MEQRWLTFAGAFLLIVIPCDFQSTSLQLRSRAILFLSEDCPRGEKYDEETDKCVPEEDMLRFECWKKGLIYYKPKRRCYSPATRGPCEEGEWLVWLQKVRYALPEATCQIKKCWQNEVDLPGRGCVSTLKLSNSSQNLCKDNEEIKINPYGYGVCTCQKTTEWKWQKDQNCYQLFRRGPCPPAHYLVLNTNAASYETVLECKPNVCIHDNMVPFNGTCLQLEKPCGEHPNTLFVDTNFKLTCADANFRFIGKAPDRCLGRFKHPNLCYRQSWR